MIAPVVAVVSTSSRMLDVMIHTNSDVGKMFMMMMKWWMESLSQGSICLCMMQFAGGWSLPYLGLVCVLPQGGVGIADP